MSNSSLALRPVFSSLDQLRLHQQITRFGLNPCQWQLRWDRHPNSPTQQCARSKRRVWLIYHRDPAFRMRGWVTHQPSGAAWERLELVSL